MRIVICIFIFFFTVKVCSAQNLFGSFIQLQNTGDEQGLKIVQDESSNTYLAGTFTSDIFTIQDQSIANQGSQDVFLAKFDDELTIEWLISLGGNSDDFLKDLQVDNDGNVVVAGTFLSSSFNVSDSIYQNNGGEDFYVLSFNNS